MQFAERPTMVANDLLTRTICVVCLRVLWIIKQVITLSNVRGTVVSGYFIDSSVAGSFACSQATCKIM